MVNTLLAASLLTLSTLSPAFAQNAMSAAPGQSPALTNQSRQVPSGGILAPTGTTTPNPGMSNIGTETAAERRAQQESDRIMTICKGC